MTKDTEALRDDQWSDANMLRSIARDVDRWPSNATCDGAPTSADTLREIADRLDAALATPASDVVAVDVDDAQALAREFKRMQGLIYCPGVLRCAKCDFRLIKTTLTPAGAFANEEPDSCPNCNVPMWRVTWQDEAHEAYRVAESQMERALGAEKKLAHPLLAQSVDPAAGDVGAVEYGDAAQDAVMRLLERGVATVNSDGYLALAHPPHPAPVDPVAGGEALREVAAKYADMGIDERAEAMADNCDGDPWELIGYFREKLRQSQARVDAANIAATGFAKRLAALKGPAA